MKNIITKILLACAALCAVSCSMNLKSYFVTDGVTLDMKVLREGAGFCHVKVEASDDAWYLLGICPEDEYSGNDEQFMTKAVWEARKEYDEWKVKYEKDNPFMIADFASHSLKYGNTETFFNFLEAGTSYRVFCFVMNPDTEKPAGKLYIQTITTKPVSEMSVKFDYRVKGYWDYVYPKDRESGKLLSDVPWVAETADSLDIRNSGAETPCDYFMAELDRQIRTNTLRILYGMYAYNNDGIGDSGDAVCFEEGHTYYTAIASCDGEFADYAYYKFTWTGTDMEILLTEKDNSHGEWDLE